jgi:hypothetical protein
MFGIEGIVGGAPPSPKLGPAIGGNMGCGAPYTPKSGIAPPSMWVIGVPQPAP